MTQKLTKPQQELLARAQQAKPITYNDGSTTPPSILVSGRDYHTAVALENKGLGTIRWQGPNLGWFSATSTQEA